MDLADVGTSTFLRELTPNWLAATARLAGEEPPDHSQPFTWVHLGGRAGVTAAVVAAAHPHAAVWSVDPDPGLTARAQRLADAAGLHNLTAVHDAHIAAPLRDDIDVLVVDDIIGTSGSDARRHVIDSADRNVRPGGFVVVAYRALAGWALLQPLVTLMRLAVETQPGSPLDAVPVAVALVEHLRELGAHHLTVYPHLSGVIDDLASAEPEDVVRQLIVPGLDPLTLAAVSEWLSPTGCSFVGSARLRDPDSAPAKLRDHVENAAPVQRELLLDLATAEMFRIDVFRKGRITADSAEAALLELVIAAIAPAEADDGTGDRTHLVLERWGEVAAPVGALAVDGSVDQSDVAGVVRRLLRSGRAAPVVHGWQSSGAVASCDALTATLQHHGARRGIDERRVVAPAVGALVPADAAARLAHLDGGV